MTSRFSFCVVAAGLLAGCGRVVFDDESELDTSSANGRPAAVSPSPRGRATSSSSTSVQPARA